MLEVQEAQPGHHPSTSVTGTTVPERLLEDSDGVTRLYYAGTVLAEARGPVRTQDLSRDGVSWRGWYLPRLLWKRACAFKMLQGAPLQQLLGPRYVVLRGEFLPFYCPTPGAKGLRLAELLDSPEPLTQRRLFELAHCPSSHS
jgi:hypothetical protein